MQASQHRRGRKPISDLQAVADRHEIEALRSEFTDTVMMCDYDRLASPFTHDGAVRIPYINAELARRSPLTWRRKLVPGRALLADEVVTGLVGDGFGAGPGKRRPGPGTGLRDGVGEVAEQAQDISHAYRCRREEHQWASWALGRLAWR